MNRTEDELAEILHLFYIKQELTDAGITYHGLSNSGILELYNTLLGSRFTSIREGEERNRRIKSNAKNETKEIDSNKEIKESKPEDGSTNPGSHGTGDQTTNPGNSGTVDQSINPGSGGTGEQSTNAGNGGTGDQSTNSGNSGHRRKEKNGKDIDNSIDVFSSVPNYNIPLQPASITPRYNAPPYCNQLYNSSTQEEKTDQLVNYHFMLKMEKEYYQSLSKHRVGCGSPVRSKVRTLNSNTNLIKSFNGVMTDLSYLKQQNQYHTYIFSVNSNKFDPEPHCSNQPDPGERSNDDEVDIMPSAGNFGLNDLLNLAVLDDSPSTLSSWIDRKISSSPHSMPTQDEASVRRDDLSSKKRPLSPQVQNVKRNKVSETCTVRQRLHDSVRIGTGPSSSLLAVAVAGPSSDTKYSSNSPVGSSGKFPLVMCRSCFHWFDLNPNTNHYCSRPPFNSNYDGQSD